MKEKGVILLNEYTCQGCQQLFKTKEDYKIEWGFWPVCSKRCEFKVIYNFIKKQDFDDNTLLEMWKIATKNDNIEELDKKSALFDISRFYVKQGLANIKFIIGSGQTIVQRDKELTSGTSGQETPPYIYKGVVHCPVPTFLEGTPDTLSHHLTKNGLSKWF